MGRHKQPTGYPEARTALAQHLYYHHGGMTGRGMLAQRLDLHEDLHRVEGQLASHLHEPCEDGEQDIELARRVLEEGEEQTGVTAKDRKAAIRKASRGVEGEDGQSNIASNAR